MSTPIPADGGTAPEQVIIVVVPGNVTDTTLTFQVASMEMTEEADNVVCLTLRDRKGVMVACFQSWMYAFSKAALGTPPAQGPDQAGGTAG